MSAAISVLILADTPAALEASLTKLSGQQLAREAAEFVIVDRTEAGIAAMAERLAGGFPVRVLRQGQASLAAAGDLAVFGASAPVLLFLDPLLVPGADLLAAHLGRHGGLQTEAAAVIGGIAAEEGRGLDRLVLEYWPRLLAFGWHASAAQDVAFGGSVSFRRDFLIEHGLFRGLGRPGFDDVDPAWRLAERPFEIVFEPAALGRLDGTATVDDYLHRAFQCGMQETVHRGAAGRSLAERIGPPAVWWSRRQMGRHDIETLYAAARQAVAGEPGISSANPASGLFRTVYPALYAAWRAGRTEATSRMSGERIGAAGLPSGESDAS